MSRFNTTALRQGTTSPVSTQTNAPAITALGGQGHVRDARSELFLLAVSNMVKETNSFHETAATRDSRLNALVTEVAVPKNIDSYREQVDVETWLHGFISFLRTTANLRTVALVIAAQAVHARLEAGVNVRVRIPNTGKKVLYHQPGNQALVSAALKRADEPGEFLAYWNATFTTRPSGGNAPLPKPVRRGVAAAVLRLYTERAVLKYDTASKGIRFSDVLRSVHPEPTAQWQQDLFAFITKGGPIPETLPMLSARQTLNEVPVAERRAITAGMLAQGGMTWEAYSAWTEGPMDAAAWEKVIPDMGYMALLRNLRNFDAAGISKHRVRWVQDVLTDPEQVARSRQLPLRFLSAYRATRDAAVVSGWGPYIEEALNLSVNNVPALPGKTLVLVDLSGSMYQNHLSDKSGLRFVDAAALFGAVIALRAEDADLFGFGWTTVPYSFGPRDSVLPLAQKLVNTTIDATTYGYPGQKVNGLGGTETVAALRETLSPDYDRVVILTDEQYSSNWATVNNLLDQYGKPVYTWNLAGYRVAQAPSGGRNRHTFGGLSDDSLRLIPLLEAGKRQDWAALFGSQAADAQ